MRTTLIIDDELIVTAKKLAADRGCSLSALVGDALRSLVDENSGPVVRSTFRIPRFDGGGAGKVDTPPSGFQALADGGELESFRR